MDQKPPLPSVGNLGSDTSVDDGTLLEGPVLEPDYTTPDDSAVFSGQDSYNDKNPRRKIAVLTSSIIGLIGVMAIAFGFAATNDSAKPGTVQSQQPGISSVSDQDLAALSS